MDLSPRYHEISDKFADLVRPFGMESIAQGFLRAADVAKTVLPAVELARKDFLLICTGGIPGSRLSDSLCFPKRFYRGSWKSQDIADSCAQSIQELFDFGFLFHIASTEFPTRTNVQMVDPVIFRDKWLPQSLLALIEMRDYSATIVPEVPIEEFFTAWYEQGLKNVVKSGWK